VSQGDQNADYRVFKEWGVRISLSEEIEDVIYEVHTADQLLN